MEGKGSKTICIGRIRKEINKQKLKRVSNILFSPISSLNRLIMPLFIHNIHKTREGRRKSISNETITRNHQAGTMYIIFQNENLFECGSRSHLSSYIIKIFFTIAARERTANKPAAAML